MPLGTEIDLGLWSLQLAHAAGKKSYLCGSPALVARSLGGSSCPNSSNLRGCSLQQQTAQRAVDSEPSDTAVDSKHERIADRAKCRRRQCATYCKSSNCSI